MDRSIAGPNGPTVAPPRAISPGIKLVASVAIVCLGLVSLGVYAQEYASNDRFTKDFAADYVSARAMLDGRDPYAPIQGLLAEYLHPPRETLRDVFPGENWHPPFKLVITLPLALLPYQVAGLMWLLISAAAYIGAALLLARGLGWRRSTGLLLGVGALILPVVQKDLSTANMNGVLLLLLVSSWYTARSGKDAWAGGAIGLAAAIKIFPLLMLLPFVAARRTKLVLSAIGSAVTLSLIGLLALGPGRAIHSIHAAGGSQEFGYWDASPANVGWWGMATRWITRNGWVPHANVAALGFVLAVGGVVLFLVLALRPRAELSRDVFWSTAPLMLLAWPIVWDHYLVLVLPWVVLGARRIPELGRSEVIAFGLVSLPLLVGLLPGGPSLAEIETWRAALVFQLPTIALIGALILDRTRLRTASTEMSSDQRVDAIGAA